MFLHLGGDNVIYVRDIIAILDKGSTLKSKDSKEFFNKCEDEGLVIRVTEDDPRSFIIAERVEVESHKRKAKTKIVVYYSPISAPTLQKRADFLTTVK